jgi:hypothetical protein
MVKQLKIIQDDQDKEYVCYTCKMKIDYWPHRIITMTDINGTPKIMHFHYFFPCWDPDLLFQICPNHTITGAGFSCDDSILDKPKMVRNLTQNIDLWTL